MDAHPGSSAGARADAAGPADAGPGRRDFHVMTKPTGAICNLDCEYCFFLSEEQLHPGAFGDATRDTLPQYCLDCDVRSACHGGCPKDRFTTTPGGEPGMHYLCAGYQAFFRHIDTPMRFTADELRAARDAAGLRGWYAAADARRSPGAPCSCGSGAPWRGCHGALRPSLTP